MEIVDQGEIPGVVRVDFLSKKERCLGWSLKDTS